MSFLSRFPLEGGQQGADVCLALKYVSTKSSVQMHSPPGFPAELAGAFAHFTLHHSCVSLSFSAQEITLSKLC